MSQPKALLVIDMQEDYLRDGRKAMFSYDTKDLVTRVNEAIARCRAEGYDIIYIKQVFQNLRTNRRFPEAKVSKMRAKLRKLGVEYV